MFKGTTIICLKHKGKVVMAGDGQVTMGAVVTKRSANKIRRLMSGKALVGFAGSTADSINLFERFEAKLEQYSGNIARAAVELAKDWRSDKILRRLEALMLVADKTKLFLLSGNGDVIEPDDDVAAIGSGGMYALAAAKGLIKNSSLEPKEIAMEAMRIASEICIYTNDKLVIEELE
jgi:ATP-dependent HslUV protease, peptidase subunit HslV